MEINASFTSARAKRKPVADHRTIKLQNWSTDESRRGGDNSDDEFIKMFKGAQVQDVINIRCQSIDNAL